MQRCYSVRIWGIYQRDADVNCFFHILLYHMLYFDFVLSHSGRCFYTLGWAFANAFWPEQIQPYAQQFHEVTWGQLSDTFKQEFICVDVSGFDFSTLFYFSCHFICYFDCFLLSSSSFHNCAVYFVLLVLLLLLLLLICCLTSQFFCSYSVVSKKCELLELLKQDCLQAECPFVQSQKNTLFLELFT